MALAWIPKSILNKTKRICSNFLWTGNKDQRVLPWVKWDQIAGPKELGGWGLKNSLMFVKALAARVGWRLISIHSLTGFEMWGWSYPFSQLYSPIQNHDGTGHWIK